MTRALSDTTTQHLGVRLTVSGWRHVAIGIAVRHLMKIGQMWDDEKVDGDEEDFAEGEDDEELELATFQHIMIRQSGHGQRVAQNHYAIDGAFVHRLGPELLSVYEQASVAWHRFVKLKSEGSAGEGGKQSRHRREASQQIGPASKRQASSEISSYVSSQHSRRLISRPQAIKSESRAASKAMVGLQRIYGPGARPRSEGQAAALELVHQPPKTSIIVLPTSSGKSVLFFSIAAMMDQQTVIVVVPFAALVDDIVQRGQAAGLHCEEWLNENSGHELQQLIVVSADRAVQGGFCIMPKG